MTILGFVALWMLTGVVATNIGHVLDYFFCGRYVHHERFLQAYPQALLAGVLGGPIIAVAAFFLVTTGCYKFMDEHNWTSIKELRANHKLDCLAEQERLIAGKYYELIMGDKWERHVCLGRKKSFEVKKRSKFKIGSKP